MEKRIKTLKMIGITALAVVCLSAVIGLVVKLSRKTPTTSTDPVDSAATVDEGIELNYSTFMFTDCLDEGGSVSGDKMKAFVTLDATVKTKESSREVEYTYAWYNPESTWATGKNVRDYVYTIYDEDDPFGVKMVCEKPFGERIVVTVKSLKNEDLSTTCVLDYLAKIFKVHMVIDGEDYGITKFTSNKNYAYKYSANALQYYDTVTFDFGVGTITPTKGYLNPDVLPKILVTDFATSSCMDPSFSDETNVLIEKYSLRGAERTLCVKDGSSYKYIDFSSPYMLTKIMFNTPSLTESFVGEIATSLNSQDRYIDCMCLTFSVYDSVRGSNNVYTVRQDLILMENTSYVFSSAESD